MNASVVGNAAWNWLVETPCAAGGERNFRLNIDDDTYELNCEKESRDVFKIDLFTKILLRVFESAAD